MFLNTLKRVILLLLGLLLIVMIAGCDNDDTSEPELENVSLRLSWQHGTQFIGFYVAQEQGFYAEEGLDVEIIPRVTAHSVADEIQEVGSGNPDYGVGAQALLLAQNDGIPVVAVAPVFQYDPAVLFARADSGIVALTDLAGHSIAIKSEAWQSIIELLLEKGGLTIEDVEPVEAGFDMTPFLEGEVDIWAGYITSEVALARSQGIELVTFPLFEYGIQISAQSIYTNQDKLKNNPEQVEGFVRASLRGWEWAIENPEAAVDIMMAMYPELPESREFHLASLDASIPLIRPPGVRVGAFDCSQWETSDILTNIESVEELCTTAILDAIWKDG